MATTSRIILALFGTVIIAAISVGEEISTNMYFEQCQDAHKSTSCADTERGSWMRKCRDKDDVHFYCMSTSPIQLAIGRLNSTTVPLIIDPPKIITSTASSINGHHSYCIEIASNASSLYSVQCRMNGTNLTEAKWIPFNPNKWQSKNIPLPYMNVTMTDSKIFCNSSEVGPVLYLLPCDSWHMCAIELVNRQFYSKKIPVVKLVDLSTVLKKTPFSCPNVGKLFSILQYGSTRQYDKPGLVAFKYQRNSLFLLPYYPWSRPSNNSIYEKNLMGFKLKWKRDQDRIFIECQSSVLHSCGLQLVTKNLQIKNSSEDCHRHLMTVEHIPGLNGTITCSAFNEFQGTWISETAYFVTNNNTMMPNEEKPTEKPHSGRCGQGGCEVTHNDVNNITSFANEIKTTEIPINGERNLNPTLESITSSPPVDDPQDPISAPSFYIIVGAVLGGIFLCFLILLPLLIHLYKRINRQQRVIRLTEEEFSEFIDGMKKEKAESRGIHDVLVLPYDRSLEISKTAIDFKTTVLGSGAFGKVVKGQYKGKDVAIKTIDSSAMNAGAFRSLLSELKIMSFLGKHEQVMELVGAITSNIKKGEVYLILEYCAHGSAANYIWGHRDTFVSFLSDDKTTYMHTSRDNLGLNLSSEYLVRWSYEVASGMEYVSSLKIYHGDLAARNILLTENLTVKIGDFGLSRQLDMENYTCYVQKGDCPLPLKWMAIESLRDLKFSIQSDVWSFGVTLWEFFSLGKIPYPGKIWNWESWKFLCEGLRLERPEFASLPIYENIMRICWEEDPKDRPTFSTLKALLKDELEAFHLIET